MSSASRQLEIMNQKGLHARAAAKFVKVAGAYAAKINVCLGSTEVCGTSIMGLMMLAASTGCEIEIACNGVDAQGALDTLMELVANKFEEE